MTTDANALHAVLRLQRAPRGEPVALLLGSGWAASILCTEPVDALTIPAGNELGAFARLEAFLERHKDRTCVGWLGYDLARDVEVHERTLVDDFEVPVLHLAAYARTEPCADVPLPPAPPVATARSFAAHTSRSDYERRVAAVVEHIRNGDIFQANLTQPFSAEWDGDPRALFWRLCEASPAPFSAYVEDGNGTAVLSSSPEEFLFRDGPFVRTRPIKGTRPRGRDATSDAQLLHELLHSEKDLAELVMIVDLLRNDLGKVARTGSVRVGPFPEHASFAQVHHLFATVTAELDSTVTNGELLRATFPGGSVTGCPKLRCLQILEQIEIARRGVYTGAISVFWPGDRMHCNIAIRTLVHRAGRIRTNTGGGITTLSDPAAEYEETRHKLAGLERALNVSASVPPSGPAS